MKVYLFGEYKLPESVLDSIYKSDELCIRQINPNNKIDIAQLFEKHHDHMFVAKISEIGAENKELFIKLLALYFYGGAAINDKIVLKDMVLSIVKKKMIVVESCLYRNLFTGFILSQQGNELLLATLNEFLEINALKLPLSEVLLKNVEKERERKEEEETVLTLHERIIDNVSYIYDGEMTVAEHHFAKSFLLDMYPYLTVRPSDLTKLKIGITIDVPDSITVFYANGIRQNALYFFELLNNMNYDVKLIVSNNSRVTNVFDEIEFYKYHYVKVENIFCEDFNLIFSFGFSLPKTVLTTLRASGVKIVSYFCGNAYLIDSEKILYNQHKERTINYETTELNVYDQLWSIPQMYKQNKHYWETLHRAKCIQVPFIWSPNSIHFIQNVLGLKNDESLLYKKKEGKLAVFEPNISLMKWCLPCVLIAEMAHRKFNNIRHLYITNMELGKTPEEMKINQFNNAEFNNLCKCMDLFHAKKITAEKRFITLEFMSKYADIAVSHQWENPLNYLYFDLAWMGWPILHNAHLCKDVGYYYSEFNYEEASEKLNEIINNHDANKKEYLRYNREVIYQYVPTNVELQKKYRGLIENLFK
jgi:hypothetical protein